MYQPQRFSNLELYRCIAMFLIVCCHWGVQTNLLQITHAHQLTAASNFYYIINMWGKMGINCFLMITGYFMCLSHITIRKFAKLYLQVVFYSLLVHMLFSIMGGYKFPIQEWLLLLLPCRDIESDNFVHAFMVWWLFIPFLNILIKSLNSSCHIKLICLSVIIFSFLTILPDSIYQITINPISWYSIIYLIASYIRKYPNKVILNTSTKFWGWLTLICITVDILSVFGLIILSHHLGKFISPYRLLVDSNAPLALLTAVTSFMFFKNLNIKYNKWINIIGSTTFGILLIHSNCKEMRHWLWRDVFDCVGHYDAPYFWAYTLGGICAVYCLCSMIDYFRICTIEKWIFSWLDRKYFKI